MAGCMSPDPESDSAVRDWLKNSASEIAGDEEQRRLHEAAEECIGVLSGSDPARSEIVALLYKKDRWHDEPDVS